MSIENDKEIEIKDEDVVVQNEDVDVVVESKGDTPSVEKRIPSVEDGIEELKAQLEKERNARFDAEKKAREAEFQATKARSEVEDTNLQLLNGAINDVKRDQASYKAAIRDAMVNGDYDKAAEYQEAMATNAAKIMRLEEGKAAYEAKMKETPEPQRPASDPVEDFASRLSPRSADWIRRNPDFVTDPRLNRKMIAAHEMAVADGMMADTNEYFDYIEQTLKVSKPRPDPVVQQEDAMSDASAPTQRRQAPPAAPVSRQGPSTTTTRPNTIRLNSAEREMAQMMGMTEQEYAKNKLMLIKEGKLPN
jgi:hypothetical protein